MADQMTRPTPRDLAAVHRNAAARPAPAPTPYERERWETAVLASHNLHSNARLVAFLLAHHADEAGEIPAGGPQHAERLAQESALMGRFARLSLNVLQTEGFLTRPPIDSWKSEQVRPITLTMPSAAARREPPHTRGRR